MAKLITKFKYLKPDARQSVGGYVKYIATREGVDKIDESYKLAPSSVKQQQLIEKILKDFPDSKEMLEYEDYLKEPTVGNASEFITRALEDNAYEVMQTKTYADYIATRPRAQRFGSHGLFTDDGVRIKLNEVSDELNVYEGNVWTVIISLRREDAQRLGYNTGERWRDMLRTQTQALAENFKIPMEHLKWYGAFHNESHHPHVHLMVYADEGIKPYLSKQGVMNLRSSLAKDIFAQDLYFVYEKQTEQRNALRQQSRELIAGIVSKINTGSYENPKLEEMLLQLADRLSKTGGKKQYGYLKADVKAMVNRIVDELASDERISSLYNLWYEQREEVIRTYTETMPERVPLSQNKEFKSIRNAVVQEAMNIVAEHIKTEEAPEEILLDMDEDNLKTESDDDRAENEPTELISNFNYRFSGDRGKKKKDTWWTDEYKKARQFFYGTKEMPPDFQAAFTLMQSEAKKANGFAMHDLGKMYLLGLGCEKDEEQAQEWFLKAYWSFIAKEASAEKKGYLQYRIGKLFSFGYGVEQDYEQAAEWYKKAVTEENPFAAYALGSLYRQGQGVKQDNKKAYALYRMAAEHSESPNAYAAYELGKMCKDGIGTAPNQSASKAWYQKAYEGFLAIEQNMADDKLYYRLGQMNLNGIGTEVDLLTAKQYFEKAAELDSYDALYGLGKLYLRKDSIDYDPKKAVDYLFKAAQKGHVYAQCTLGSLFLKGKEVPKNTDYALLWLEEAIKEENAYAEYLLGKTLLKGEDTKQDIDRAVRLLTSSAEQKNCCAQYTLGKAYLEGNLLLQNIPQAIRLLTESAESGFSPAEYLFGKLLYHGEVVGQDISKALLYLERAAEKENACAAYLAGKIRLTEDGYTDIQKTVRLFQIAAAQGNHYAEYQLGLIYLRGKDLERDEPQAIRWLTLSSEHGNQYAAQLLRSIKNNRNWFAAMSTLRLLHHTSRMIRNRLEDERKGKNGSITDRKLRRKIQEKNEALGIKQG